MWLLELVACEDLTAEDLGSWIITACHLDYTFADFASKKIKQIKQINLDFLKV